MVLSSRDPIELEGRFHPAPDSPPAPGAVLCHPYPPGGGSLLVKVVRAVARALAAHGVAALRFNFRGVGTSGGSFDGGRGEVEDVAGALDWLATRDDIDAQRLALVGYSFGATMALHEAHRRPRLRALALIAPPVRWETPLPALPVAIPVLAVAGDRDSYCPVPALREHVAGVRTARVEIVPGADHFFLGDEDEVAGRVSRFLVEMLEPGTRVSA